MISSLLGIVSWFLRLISTAFLVYCVMTFVMPQSNIMRTLARYVEPILNPFRQLLYRIFPKLRAMPVDFSPLLVWLVIDVLMWLINLLRYVL